MRNPKALILKKSIFKDVYQGIATIFESKELFRIFLLLIINYLILELYYTFFISQYFIHLGYFFNFNLFKYIIVKLFFLILFGAGTGLYSSDKFLFCVYVFLLFLFYIPNAILFSLSNEQLGPYASNLFFVGLFSLSARVHFSLPSFSIDQKIKDGVVYVLVLLVVPFLFIFKDTFNLKTLFLGEIYETRAVFSEKISGYLGYAYHLLVKTVLPLSTIYFLIKRNWIPLILIVFAQIYLYVISGNKVVYFSTFTLFLFHLLGSDFLSKTLNFFKFMLLCLIAIPLIDITLNEPLLCGTFVNRMIFIPALLNQWYFDFFNGQPFYFAESHFFNHFVESPYEMPIGFLLTKIYWGQPTVYANNGIVSDGYMNLGYWGVIIFSVMFSILFRLFSAYKLHAAYFGVFIIYLFMFLSAPFLSCFITGGIILFIILAFFILQKQIY